MLGRIAVVAVASYGMVQKIIPVLYEKTQFLVGVYIIFHKKLLDFFPFYGYYIIKSHWVEVIRRHIFSL